MTVLPGQTSAWRVAIDAGPEPSAAPANAASAGWASAATA